MMRLSLTCLAAAAAVAAATGSASARPGQDFYAALQAAGPAPACGPFLAPAPQPRRLALKRKGRRRPPPSSGERVIVYAPAGASTPIGFGYLGPVAAAIEASPGPIVESAPPEAAPVPSYGGVNDAYGFGRISPRSRIAAPRR
jgi:hypothetical protein